MYRLTEPAKKGQVGSFYRYRLIPQLNLYILLFDQFSMFTFDRIIPVSIVLEVIQAVVEGHLVFSLPTYVKGGLGLKGLLSTLSPHPSFRWLCLVRLHVAKLFWLQQKGHPEQKRPLFMQVRCMVWLIQFWCFRALNCFGLYNLENPSSLGQNKTANSFHDRSLDFQKRDFHSNVFCSEVMSERIYNSNYGNGVLAKLTP